MKEDPLKWIQVCVFSTRFPCIFIGFRNSKVPTNGLLTSSEKAFEDIFKPRERLIKTLAPIIFKNMQ